MTFTPWPDLPHTQLEQQLLELWKSERLFERTIEATRNGRPFVFYEGPPTANGKPGIHHVFARTIKDLFCRYQVMQGRQVTRIAGWDTHGLPVEIEVEKELQLTGGKRDIETFGVAEFNRRARESVFRYQSEWERLSDRIGYWLDYERPYVTCSKEYIETVWWILRRLFDRDLLYRGHRVLPYCPRCGTVLSSHELALGYEEVHDRSVYVTFPLTDGSGRELVVWTTTPWTLPSNVAAAVNPELEYGTYRTVTGRMLILATSRSVVLEQPAAGAGGEGPVLVERFRGSALLGLEYERPLDVVPLPEGLHSVVVAGDFVTHDDGSGIVHLAPAFGADDYAAGKEHGLAMVRPVAADGTFSGTSWPAIEGKLVTADETNEIIIRRLKQDGRWLRTEQYVHTYPHCWRCRSKLIYYARDSWFVRTSAVKERMLEINRAVNWHPPEVGAGRFGEWLENNVDWALSRDRYWGTPLPVWVSDADPAQVEVIGSYAELAARAGITIGPDFDPHKPGIDEVTWPAPGGGTMRRVPEVIDTWFDSGSMPYAQWHYPFEHEQEFRAHFPADFICEGIDQTRGWFYSLLAIATAAFDSTAYRSVVVNELVLDAEGQKMSKSRGNVVDPWTMIDQFGADAVRLYLLMSSQVWLPKRFDVRAIPESAGGFLNTLKNTYEFFRLYAGSSVGESLVASRSAPGVSSDQRPATSDVLADRWILSRLAATVDAVHEAWSAYDGTQGCRALADFVVDDLSNWYVRTNRGRFWAPDREADPAAVATLQQCLLTVSRLLAPAAPFVSDWIHRSLTGVSVHLARLPEAGAPRDVELERAMDAVRRLASLGRAARDEANLRVRQPLRAMAVAVPGAVRGPTFDRLLEILRREVNVREIDVVASDVGLVILTAKPNFRTLGKRYGKGTPAVAAAAARLTPEQLRALEAGQPAVLTVEGAEVTFLPEDVVIEQRAATTDWLVQGSGPFVAALDPRLTEELRHEGLARELVNRVQRLRKEAGYEYTTRIALAVDGAPELLRAVEAHGAFISGETLARRLNVGGRAGHPDVEQDVVIEGLPAVVGVERFEFEDGRR